MCEGSEGTLCLINLASVGLDCLSNFLPQYPESLLLSGVITTQWRRERGLVEVP